MCTEPRGWTSVTVVLYRSLPFPSRFSICVTVLFGKIVLDPFHLLTRSFTCDRHFNRPGKGSKLLGKLPAAAFTMLSLQLSVKVVLATCVASNVFAHPLIARSDVWTDWDYSSGPTSTPNFPSPQTSAVSPLPTSITPTVDVCTPGIPCTSSIECPSPTTFLVNLIGIPQAGDIAILSNDTPLPQDDLGALYEHIQQDLTHAALGSNSNSSSSSGHLRQVLTNRLNETSNGFDSPSEELSAPELSALFNVCFEDENCMFFNTSTSVIIDIFRYQASTNLTTYAENPWTLFAHALATQTANPPVVGLGLIFATNFYTAYTTGSAGMYLSFQSAGISASAPGILRLVDAYAGDQSV